MKAITAAGSVGVATLRALTRISLPAARAPRVRWRAACSRSEFSLFLPVNRAEPEIFAIGRAL